MNQSQKKETLRKLIHISSLILPFSYKYLFHFHRKLTFVFLVPITLTALLIEIFRLEHKTFKRLFFNIFGILLRKHEIQDFTGATYLLISSVVCIAVFPKNIAFLALSFLAIGDTMAAIIGINFGKRIFPGSQKSVEGSLACFIASFIFALFFIHPAIAFFGALGTTIAEVSKIPFDDNIKIPVISGLFMSFVYVII